MSPVSDPASTLLSPPSAKTPPANKIHPFFTPRRILSKITPNSRSSRVHLLSPEESPSRRCKRARLGTPTNLKNEAKNLFPSKPSPPAPAPVLELVEPRKRISASIGQRLFMRSLNGFGPRHTGSQQMHCAGWSSEGMSFYSRPQDVHTTISSDASNLPFSTAACNRNSLVAVGDEHGTVRLIESSKDENPGFSQPYLKMQCHNNAIFHMSWSMDDHLLASASGDQTCGITDVIKQKKIFSLKHHENSVKQICFNPHNPQVLASCGRDGIINIWDLRISGTRVQEGEDIITVLSPVHTIREIEAKRPPPSITSLVWTQEHRVATTGQSSAIIKVWDLKSSLSKRRKPLPLEISPLPIPHRGFRDYGMNWLTLSPDSQRLYALCKDNNLYAYAPNHLEQGPIHVYNHPKLLVSTFYVKTAISRDGRFLATGSSDGSAILFPTDEKYFDKRMYTDFSQDLSPLAKHMPVGSGVALVRGHERETTDLTWTMGGDLVTVSDDSQARCWRNGYQGEAASLREGGEDEGRRWMWGWSEM